MELNFAIEKLKKMTGLESIDNYQEDIEKLVDAHNNGILNLHTRMKVVKEQILLDLDNLYDRMIESLKYYKDSASLEIHIIRYGDVEGQKRYDARVSKTVQSLENYIKKYGEIDGPIKFKQFSKSRSMSLESCIMRHGKEKGEQVFREYWDNTSFGTSKRAFKKRHGDDWEKYYNQFRESQGKNATLSGKISKYGEEEGTRRYIESNAKKSKSLSKEKFVEKLLKNGYSFNEIQSAIKDRWDNISLDSFKVRYGEYNGKIKYDEYIKKSREANPLCIEYYEKRNISEDIAFELISKIQWERNLKIDRISKESLKYLDRLNEIFGNRGYDCHYKENEMSIMLERKEYELFKKNRFFFYDFFVPDLNLIIEYHGIRFHDDVDYDSTLDLTENGIYNMEYNRDLYKKWIAEKRGYTVLILRSWKIDEDLKKMFDMLNFTEEEKCKFV